MSKLTLSIKQSTIDDAKAYAKENGKSLSSIVEEYLKSLAAAERLSREKSTIKLVAELRGSVKMPEEYKSYDDILEEALLDKYLRS